MSLDDYRQGLLWRLKACTDTGAARTLLAEADLVLVSARLTDDMQSKFWESLDDDLQSIAESAKLLADREAAMKLAAIIAAAQARIARYRERLSEDR